MIPAYFHTAEDARRAEASLPMGMDGGTPVMVAPYHGRPWVIEVDVDPSDTRAFQVALGVIDRYQGEFHQQPLTTRPGGAPFMNRMPQSVIDRYEAEQAQQAQHTAVKQPRSLDELAKAGYCTEDWQRWHQGQCGTYAMALMQEHPHLRFGTLGGTFKGGGDASEGWSLAHHFAHDDTHAYDAAGKHPLPYSGVHGDSDYAELDGHPSDYDPLGEEGTDEGDLAEAKDHARRNSILEGRYGPS